MPATKEKTDVLAELGRLESEWAGAAEATRGLGLQHKQKQDELLELLDQRQGRLHRVPGEFHHDGTPMPDTEAAEIQATIDGLGQVDFRPEIQHAERLERVAKEAAHAFIAENFPAIVEELRPQAQATALAVRECIEAATDAGEAYLLLVQRVIGLVHAVPGVDVRTVPGLDAAAELLRVLRGRTLPVPLPEVEHE